MLKIEDQLLIKCSSLKHSAQNIKDIEISLKQKINWAYFFQQINFHEIAPLVYTNLKKIHKIHHVPLKWRRKIEFVWQYNRTKNIFFLEETRRLLRVLKKQQIPAIPLKGPILGWQIYRQFAVRWSIADIDILVPEKSVAQALALLVKEKYSPTSQGDFLLRGSRYHLVLEKKEGNEKFVLELHWRLARAWYRVDPSGIWQRAKKRKALGIDTLLLSNEDIFILLLLKFSTDHYHFQLKNLIDLRNFEKENGINFRLVGNILKKAGLKNLYNLYQKTINRLENGDNFLIVNSKSFQQKFIYHWYISLKFNFYHLIINKIPIDFIRNLFYGLQLNYPLFNIISSIKKSFSRP